MERTTEDILLFFPFREENLSNKFEQNLPGRSLVYIRVVIFGLGEKQQKQQKENKGDGEEEIC